MVLGQPTIGSSQLEPRHKTNQLDPPNRKMGNGRVLGSILEHSKSLKARQLAAKKQCFGMKTLFFLVLGASGIWYLWIERPSWDRSSLCFKAPGLMTGPRSRP